MSFHQGPATPKVRLFILNAVFFSISVIEDT